MQYKIEDKQISVDSASIEDTLRLVLAYFQLGRLSGYTQSKLGLSNATYMVTTQSKESYVVRVLAPHKRDMNVLHNEMFVHQVLKARSIKSAVMLSTPRGEFFYKDKGIVATVSRLIDGMHPAFPLDDNTCFLIGRTLALFHTALHPFTLPESLRGHFLDERTISLRIHDMIEGSYKKEVGLLFEGVKKYPANLPAGILHGDLHSGNVLTCGDVAAVLDLQNLHHGPFILDIGRSMADICSDTKGLNLERAASFLSGYESVRVLDKTEKDALEAAILYGAIAVSTWFYDRAGLGMANHFLKVAQTATPMSLHLSF